jgi:hypothetical protein
MSNAVCNLWLVDVHGSMLKLGMMGSKVLWFFLSRKNGLLLLALSLVFGGRVGWIASPLARNDDLGPAWVATGFVALAWIHRKFFGSFFQKRMASWRPFQRS